jgi:hypothetical protein
LWIEHKCHTGELSDQMMLMRRNFLTSIIAPLATAFLACAAQEPTQNVDLIANWPAPLYWQPASGHSPASEHHGRIRVEAAVQAAATTPGTPAVFVAISPCRVIETRNPGGPYGGPAFAAGETRTYAIPTGPCAGIPATAVAFSVNIAVIPLGTQMKWLTAWDAGSPQPHASTLNDYTGQITSNSAVVPAGTDGAINIFVTDPTQVIVDINGYYAPPGTLPLTGTSISPVAAGVEGLNTATSGFAVGVQGATSSNSGAGVNGNASVAGAVGVLGNNGATSGITTGVAGNASSPNGAGVSGYNSDTSGTGYPVGVVGSVAGSTGTGVQGNANHAGASGVNGFNSAPSGFAVGVQGGIASTNGAGVQGNASQAGATGVSGWNSATSGYAVGVEGGTSSTNGAGVSGNSNRAGVFGTVGFNSATSGYAIGTEGASSSPGGVGVWAVSMACGSGGCTLVPGTAGQFQTATTGVLLQGIAGAAGANIGTAAQVFLVDGHGNGSYAGNLQVGGNLNVGGTISKSGGSFRIDDPIDPENKYLYHSFVESPDMKNIYDGVVSLDERGRAVVVLPEWFEALNQDFRYQLTCIGGYAPVYVASEISHNEFRIDGGSEGMKVSWQVTGVRHDGYANSHRIPVEVEKSANEKGVIDPVTPAATMTR